MDEKYNDLELLKKHAAQLGEHFDSVQIIATRFDAELDQTVRCSWGAGNYYARYGSIKNWLTIQDAEAAADGMTKAAGDDEGDDE